MFDALKQVFGFGNPIDFSSLVSQGAQIVDVRSQEEFSGGHLKGSINIPLQSFSYKLSSLRKDKPIIVCCASGARSFNAARILKSSGYTDVHNGGGWRGLQNKLHL